ncbi:CidA/LrgA family protein [Moraxella catarrhalis]|uniref:CidA/LrgA family protein n=1 Tax=Moraxella catarrhalis TaxID=480 RepID=UPI000202A754|nr:CidA/LrgA family protein [Moraxella catarrhalis]AXT97896.1 LrgA [Moraxella catarrhalis]EGE18202.1 LrgA family protein [Moraxella catarrhalis BC7]EKF83220.1 LrgA family protein [Moraxella catarrhalis RH4]MCG6816742.1 CidA/LrgA family protein [Moraxella catarrhalis]MPW50964.1 murein hydrolase regulator LrgA [Moraxella catarrhalis]
MILKAIMIVFGCLFLGQLIVGLFDLLLPPSVVGLILLFLALQVGLVKLATIEKLAKVFMDYLVLLVVPACISIMQYLDIIRDDFWVLIIGVSVSTILVLLTSAGSYTWLRKLQKSHAQTTKNQGR